jgi:hypothetical protein
MNTLCTADYARDQMKATQACSDLQKKLVQKISSDQQLSLCQKVEDDFNCMICLNFVREPVECSNCEKLFCQKCINAWKLSCDIQVPKCAHCKAMCEFKPPNRILMKFYN